VARARAVGVRAARRKRGARALKHRRCGQSPRRRTSSTA
jgi:hypothetical protein